MGRTSVTSVDVNRSFVRCCITASIAELENAGAPFQAQVMLRVPDQVVSDFFLVAI